ncbi:hypothetical protein [Mucilaginibacter gotjawali]|uniref:Uncharacterized protein n=2 Tax=Mucilaginibacter gotjawali TaxID=1550579 RepID=A0A839S8R7_9SPHI|nr:hypothetical protein [Mucilaginibacter gotjawali]MBB3053762.1 hypothetical protein [Mucilaginibacter gotjawali]BAU54023.1 hypothetical protein MgSA37_02194 [Mucilaginibacter gotjawali]
MNQLKITHSQSHSLAGTDTRIEHAMPYEQGSTGGLVQFSLICHEIPLGTTVGFSSDKPGPHPPINLLPTIVSIYPSFITGMVSDVPADYSATITFYAIFNQPPPVGASIQLQAAFVVQN